MNIKYLPRLELDPKDKKQLQKFGLEEKYFYYISPTRHFINPTGKKLLIVCDWIPNLDLKLNSIGGESPSGITLNNILKYCNEKTNNGLKEYLVYNYYRSSTYNLLHDQKMWLDKKMFSYLEIIISKYNPDVVVFSGENSARQAFSFTENENIKKYYGRLKKFKCNNVEMKGILALQYSDVCSNNQTEFNTVINLISILQEQFINAINGKNKYTINIKNTYKIEYIDNMRKWKSFYKLLLKSKTPCIDTETENLCRIKNKILTIQFSLDGKIAYFLPLFHVETPFTVNELKIISQDLKYFFEYGVPDYVIFHNAKFDLSVMMTSFNIKYFNINVFDTIASSFSLNENRKFLQNVGFKSPYGPYSLATLEAEYGIVRPTNLAVDKENRGSMAQFKLSDIVEYGSIDVITTFRIHEVHLKEAEDRGQVYLKFKNLVTRQISDTILCFTVMEHNGIPVDINYLMNIRSKTGHFAKEAYKIQQKFNSLLSVVEANKLLLKDHNIQQTKISLFNKDPIVFDINKKNSQQKLFFDVLNIKIDEYRKDGGGKLDKLFKNKNKDKYEEVKLLIEYESVKKLKSTYADGIYKKMIADPDMVSDQHLRCNYGFAYVLTGRTNARDPNLQAIPSRGSLASLIKRQFVSGRGKIINKIDYVTHEYRGWGNISGDINLCNFFRNALNLKRKRRFSLDIKEIEEIDKELAIGGDLHICNASYFFNIDPLKVTKDQRFQAKSVGFGVLYGKGAKSLAIDIKGDEEQAQELIDKLFEKYPNGAKFIKDTHNFAKNNLVVVSPIGRPRHLWGYLHSNNSVHGAQNRRGPNSLIQGLCSDIGYSGGRYLQQLQWELFHENELPVNMDLFNMVHDSSESEVCIEHLPISLYVIEHALTTMVHRKYREVFDWKMLVDLEIDIEIGPSLGYMKDWDWKPDTLYNIAEDAMKWQNENLNYNYSNKEINTILHKVKHNAKILHEVRRREIMKATNQASEVMLVNKNNIKKIGLLF